MDAAAKKLEELHQYGAQRLTALEQEQKEDITTTVDRVLKENKRFLEELKST